MDNSFDEILREANQTFRVTGNEFLCSFDDNKGLELMKIDLTKAGNNLFISFNPVKHTSQPMNIVNDIANNGRPFKMDFSVVRVRRIQISFSTVIYIYYDMKIIL